MGGLVLFHCTKYSISRSLACELDDRWSGSYRIREIPDNSAFCLLEEPDGTSLTPTFASNRLKQFFSRAKLGNNRSKAHDTIRVRGALKIDEGSQPENTDFDEGVRTRSDWHSFGLFITSFSRLVVYLFKMHD